MYCVTVIVQATWEEKAAAVDNCETVIFYKIEEIQVLSFSFKKKKNLKSQMLPLYSV